MVKLPPNTLIAKRLAGVLPFGFLIKCFEFCLHKAIAIPLAKVSSFGFLIKYFEFCLRTRLSPFLWRKFYRWDFSLNNLNFVSFYRQDVQEACDFEDFFDVIADVSEDHFALLVHFLLGCEKDS